MYLDVSPYKEVLAGVEAALAINEGVIKVTGPDGTGKTALGYQLSSALQKRGRQVVFFLHAPRTPEDLQTGILRQLHLREKGNFTRRLTEYLQSLAPENRLLHVLIDNAEELNDLTFNAVRMLCNIQDDTQSLVRVLLLASPKLNELMGQAELRSFAQHLSHSFQLQPMQGEQLKNFCWAYWRQKQIERSPPDDRWTRELLKLSGGLPGAVLAELGDEEHRNEINISARLEQVVEEDRAAAQIPLPSAVTPRRGLATVLWLVLVLLLGGAAFLGYREWLIPLSTPTAATPPTSRPSTPVTTVAQSAATPPATPAAAPTATVPPVAVATPETALSPEEEAGIVAEAEVVRLLNLWVQNWQVQNLPGYFSSYGAAFMPESFDSRTAWEAERRRIISAARDVSVSWRELQFRERSDQSVVVELWLDYRSATYADRTLKELTLGFENGRAVILRERNLTVQP